MRDAYDDEEPGGRGLLWIIFAVLVLASIAAVAWTWRSAGFDRLAAMAGADRLLSWISPASTSGQAVASTVDAGERIGAWLLACDAAACSLTQTLRQSDVSDVSWRIERNTAGDLVGIWTLPTGVLVGRGMQLALDEGKPSVVPYESCAPASCEVRAKLGADFIELMRAAGKTRSTVTLKGGDTRTYDFGHDGLQAGLARLASAKPQ
ncbi:invasion associated locus B family protein [Kaistia sp. MMO-174]|uniref:invasion associated locus B family protein n=1 Tax=Kaistia sp. MMO-174 TaxID=3081256 RepID=UPI001ACF159B|nr:invasion associated locus B family protein [Hyphomicrobiales bacterium]